MRTREEPMTDDQVRDILFKIAAGFPLARIAKLYGRPYQTVLRIRNFETYRHVSREGVEEAAKVATWAKVEAPMLPDIGEAVPPAPPLPPIGPAVPPAPRPVMGPAVPPAPKLVMGPAVPRHDPVRREQEIVEAGATASAERLARALQAEQPRISLDDALAMMKGEKPVDTTLTFMNQKPQELTPEQEEKKRRLMEGEE